MNNSVYGQAMFDLIVECFSSAVYKDTLLVYLYLINSLTWTDKIYFIASKWREGSQVLPSSWKSTWSSKKYAN